MFIDHDAFLKSLNDVNSEAPNVVDVQGLRFYRHWNSAPFVQQADIDLDKVAELVEAMNNRVPLPRTVLASYGERVLVIDGHHRSLAARQANSVCYCWICDGDEYDDFSCQHGSFEADKIILETLQPYIEQMI